MDDDADDNSGHDGSKFFRRRRATRRLRDRNEEVRAGFKGVFPLVTIVVFVGFVIWLMCHHAVDIGASVVHSFTNPVEMQICSDDAAIKHLQSIQLRKARIEVFAGNTKKGFTSISGDDLGFYHRNFGAMMIKAKASRSRYTKILYYRIWKSANNAIRKILHMYARSNSYNERNYEACKLKQQSDCFSQSKFPSDSNSLFDRLFLPLQEKTFSFTFVRNPFSRLLSAYIEIERSISNANGKKGNDPILVDFKHPVGSYERFIEFINFILLSNGSMKLFRERHVDMSMAAPMIGTLVLGLKR